MNHAPQAWDLNPQLDIADVGCGVDLSTRDIASLIMGLYGKELPLLRMKAVDPFHYFFAVAEVFQAEADAMKTGTPKISVEYIHGLGKNTIFPDDSLDLYTIQVMKHELPDSATIAVVAEVFRVLRPGGVFAMLEAHPRGDGNREFTPRNRCS
ncbi:Sterol 24-C-methyltransferase [Gracilariopsis chorda]|uniref:Sterol 24-C-methyltransferase n=1 Tax=Gracilariopsis chorda TaxID=448386 RepID=A0A2V3IS86_9FLOR|nr:Sterol 24-C-methyltransferase [Gracilariopsis chorda]|eukprot:PXF44964.1 Sterol 24-C-methyltransferase [Gracilariopsis chorda]